MSEPKQPCEVCGETEPKNWEDYRPKGCSPEQPFWNCPLCGHLVLYLNMGVPDTETGEWKNFGAPQWVYDYLNAKYNLIKSDDPLIVDRSD